MSDAQWKPLTHLSVLDADAVESKIYALLPTSTISTTFWDLVNEVDAPAFYAEAGIFLEPSFPRPTPNLADDGSADGDGLVASPRVSCGPEALVGQIDLQDEAVGQRGTPASLTAPSIVTIPSLSFDRVSFSVRRVRRWHEVLEDFADSLTSLRYCYETRFGTIATHTNAGSFATLVAEGEGTQLGPFDSEDVNVNPGDIVRVLHPVTSEVIAIGEVASVDSGTQLTIKPPGLLGDVPDGYAGYEGFTFEVFLRIAPVPHQQSNEELLELATDQLIYSRQMEWNPDTPDSPAYPDNGGFVLWDTSEVGTWDEYAAALEDPPTDADRDEWKALVYEASVNRFTDTNAGIEQGQINFQQEGVEAGDILIIDPSGNLEPLDHPDGADQEVGTRPYGDTGTPNRTEDEREPGRPAELDDNRGYYVVMEVTPTELLVAPYEESPFSGPNGVTNRIVEPASPSAFSWYPTISGSEVARDGKEGQTDLRPTAWSGTCPTAPDDPTATPVGSFKNCPLSIAPVSWKVIRPSGFFSEESMELVLFHRERIFSLIENFEEAMRGGKSGSYRVFREDRHIFDLGNPNIASEGLGVPFNRFLYDIAGYTSVSPFLNDSDCLSILDRRFFCQDYTLDEQKPPFSDYADPTIAYYADLTGGVGRPLLIDRIEEVLNNSDAFRGLRYAWLTYRAHRIDGTLAKVKRWDRELPKRIREMERLRRMTEGAGGR